MNISLTPITKPLVRKEITDFDEALNTLNGIDYEQIEGKLIKLIVEVKEWIKKKG